MKKYLGIILCTVLVLTGCGYEPKLENGKEVVAELEGKTFIAEDLYAQLKKTYGTAALVNLVDNFIVDKEKTDELVKEAEKYGTSQIESYKSYYKDKWLSMLASNGYANEQQFKEELISGYLKNSVLTKYVKDSVVTEKEANEYYEKDIFGEITARHILIIPENKTGMTDAEKTKAKEDALKEAKEIIEQLKTSTDLENDFTKIAKEKSDDTGSKESGGLIKDFTNESGLVKEFWEASLKLEVGKFTLEAVETEFGYHVIYKVSQKEKPVFADVKDTVYTKVAENLLEASENSGYVYWAGLREKYGLKINDTVLKDSYDATLKNLK